MLNIPAEYDKRYFADKINGHFSISFSLLRYHVSLLVLAGELWCMHQEWLQLRWARTTDQKMAAVHGTLCMIPPRNSQQQPVTSVLYLHFYGD
jgi:hypothetical protein